MNDALARTQGCQSNATCQTNAFQEFGRLFRRFTCVFCCCALVAAVCTSSALAADERPLFDESDFPPLPTRRTPSAVESDAPLPEPARNPFAEAESPAPNSQLPTVAPADFDWTQQRLSVADLNVGEQLRYGPQITFAHGKPDLTNAETHAYAELVNTIAIRRLAAQKDAAGELLTESATVNVWEASFYKFEEARRLAWQNGHLQIELQDARSGGLTDPFASVTQPRHVRPLLAPPAVTSYSLIDDMKTHPADFVGRPVALYGLFTPSGAVELPNPNALASDPQIIRLQRGFLRNLTNTRDLAIVDAGGRLGPNNQIRPAESWPADANAAIPVLIKGWFVKLWGQQPLILTEAVRILTPRPYEQVIQLYVKPRTPVSDDEKWIYYETLRQMQLSNAEPQAQLALEVQQRRLSALASEIREKVAAENVLLDGALKSGSISEEEFRIRRTRLARQLDSRLARNDEYHRKPESFPLYADIFTNSQNWQGSLVTLQGYVRQVISYPGDAAMFGGQPLHELWLFTEDSQHNPAVIVTASLPRDFPSGAPVIDRVTVTGCFFKPYVYRSTAEHRIAPLILAGRITWNPTDDQVRSLAAAGHLPAEAGFVKAAIRRGESRISQTTVMLGGFLAIVVMMTIWGRMQRDRREQRRLMALVDADRDPGHTLPDETSFEAVSAFSSGSNTERFRG